MTRPKKPPSVKSFGPELMAALLRGALTPHSIEMPANDATRLRLRLHSLRSAMSREGHEKLDIVERTSVRIDPDPRTLTDKRQRVRLIIAPRDTEFTDVLRSAGLDADLPGDIPEPGPGPSESPDGFDDFLDNIQRHKPITED